MIKEIQPEHLVNAGLKAKFQGKFGVLDSAFLARSLSTLNPREPIGILGTDSIFLALSTLKKNKIGAVLVLDEAGKLIGIFTERDAILKVFDSGLDIKTTPISKCMTGAPVSLTFDTSIAYALNIMSTHGFRHVPIVDEDGVPRGLVSIKDVVDAIVLDFSKDLLEFEPAKG